MNLQTAANLMSSVRDFDINIVSSDINFAIHSFGGVHGRYDKGLFLCLCS